MSAFIHKGWNNAIPKDHTRQQINDRWRRQTEDRRAHAFAIVGYDETGFIIQNSWGTKWSAWDNRPGLAHWSYEDWALNVIDGWVLRLAPKMPGAFGLVANAAGGSGSRETADSSPLASLRKPRQSSLIGHCLDIERDGVIETGQLGMGLKGLRESAKLLNSEEGCRDYPELGLLFHDPLLEKSDIARLAAHLTPLLKQRHVYPIHLTYGADEARNLTVRMRYEAAAAAARSLDAGEDLSNFLERRARAFAYPLLASYRDGLERACQGGSLWQALAVLGIEAERELPIRLVGFGAGCLAALAVADIASELGLGPWRNVTLIAPPLRPFTPAKAVDWPDRIKTIPLHSNRPYGYVMPRYKGDWNDLLASLLGHSELRSDRGHGTTVQSCYLAPEVLRTILAPSKKNG